MKSTSSSSSYLSPYLPSSPFLLSSPSSPLHKSFLSNSPISSTKINTRHPSLPASIFKSEDNLIDLNNDYGNNNNNNNNNNNHNNNNNNNNKINLRRKSDGFVSFPKSVYNSTLVNDIKKDEKEEKDVDKSSTWDYIDIQVN